MNKLSYLLIAIICICLSACSYDVKHIRLNESSDTGWTEVRKPHTSTTTEIIKPNRPPSSNSVTQSNSSDLSEYAQKLRELKKLKDEGLLTDDEYERKRRAIVDGM
jgi:hypothetical protein